MKSAFFIATLAISCTAFAGDRGESSHDKRSKSKPDRQPASMTQSASAAASARSTSVAGAFATGGAGGNAHAAGGNATATGGQVGNISVTTGAGGLSGRMVPDVSATSPITSTTCRNGITAGGSGNGWGGLLGFFQEDDACEWRLLEANYRATGDTEKANAIRNGMTVQRCRKLSDDERAAFGDLCPTSPAKPEVNPAFASAG